MKYALGNMLNGAGGLNPDGLSLDLQFAADKTLTARRGPTPVLTRGSGNNGGTTYFGPLIDITGEGNEFPTSGITNGRAEWSASGGGTTWRVFYTGTRWKVEITSSAPLVEYFAATGSEWRPDQANWSGSGTSVITSSTFGIVKAANDEPRFDHDTVSPFACRGLLIEEGRTNLITGSNSFNNWAQSNCTVAASSVVTPEGSANAWKIVEDSLTAAHFATTNFTPASGTTYTASVWLKSAENGFAFVGLTGGGFSTTFISVNLSTGAVSTAVGTPIGATSVSHSNGWWRVSFSLAATASLSSNVDIRTSRDGNWANRSYLGNGVNGMYCYGAQAEAGSFATSYIPTTTSTLARAADVCSITAPNFATFYNQPEGTFLSNSSQPFITAANAQVYAADNGTDAERFNLRHQTSFAVTQTGGTTQSVIDFIDPTANAVSKIAYAYANANYSGARNGTLGTSSPNLTVPTVNRIFIGSKGHNSSEYLNGHIAVLRYYKKRLPGAKLQALTA